MPVPFYLFQGRYDYNTPGEVAEHYFEMLESSHKSLIWFEESAHFL
jgi:esterase/lipase